LLKRAAFWFLPRKLDAYTANYAKVVPNLTEVNMILKSSYLSIFLLQEFPKVTKVSGINSREEPSVIK